MDDDWDVFTPTPPVPIGDSEAIVQSTPAQCSGSPDSPDDVTKRRGTHKAYIPSPFTPMPKYEAMGDEQLKVGVPPFSFSVNVVMLGGKFDFFILQETNPIILMPSHNTKIFLPSVDWL